MVSPIAPAASSLLAPLSAPVAEGANDGVGGAIPDPQRATAALGARSVRLDVAALTAVQAKGSVDSVSPEEQEVIAELKARDREVRRHEAAHARTGGEFAGTPHYEFTRGPDGRAYAVGGTTPIDVNPVAGNPEATIQKMQTVKRAALAPAEAKKKITDQAIVCVTASRTPCVKRKPVIVSSAAESR